MSLRVWAGEITAMAVRARRRVPMRDECMWIKVNDWVYFALSDPIAGFLLALLW
jgi:hypothetical protein